MYPKILNTKENLSQEKKRKKEHQNKKQEFIIQIFFLSGKSNGKPLKPSSPYELSSWSRMNAQRLASGSLQILEESSDRRGLEV